MRTIRFLAILTVLFCGLSAQASFSPIAEDAIPEMFAPSQPKGIDQSSVPANSNLNTIDLLQNTNPTDQADLPSTRPIPAAGQN